MIWFAEGGPFMWFILLTDMVVGGGLLLVTLLAVGSRFMPGLAWPARIGTAMGAAAAVGPVVLGLIGWQLGLMQVTEAVRHASPEMKDQLQEAGQAIAIIPFYFGIGSTLVLGACSALGMGIAALPHRAAAED